MPKNAHLFVSDDPLVTAAALHHPIDRDVLLEAIEYRQAMIEWLMSSISFLQLALRRLRSTDGCPFGALGLDCPFCGPSAQLPLKEAE